MAKVVGETKFLKASEFAALEKLATKKVNPRQIVGADIAKRAAKLSQEIGVQLGLLVARDGRVESVVVGTHDRLYLPDLGRFRLDAARLRSLRLVLFLPPSERWLKRYVNQAFVAGLQGYAEEELKQSVLSPTIADDIITDLSKLRLDMVCVIAATEDGAPGSLSLSFLEPQQQKGGANRPALATDKLAFFHTRSLYDFEIDFEEFIEDLETRFRAIKRDGHVVGTDNALLIGAYTGGAREAQSSMAELEELARTAGINVLDHLSQRRRKLDPKTLVGKGKLEEIVLYALDQGADLLIFDGELSPGQLRSITNLTDLRVIDRSILILDIFAQRAKTADGRMQVELAQLRYTLPRLTESNTGLSRLTGGIGGRGPGETKLEIGRRRARDRITALEKKINKIAKQRGLRRERRQLRGVPVIAIVGYTNAGKSTLLNALTKGEVFVENKLFATLDPSTRRMRFPNEKEVVFVDTVGFIRELPKELVNAFRATLEEIGEADILVHLVDASDPDMQERIEVVERTLDELKFAETPRILVLNKIDLLSELEVRMLMQSLEAIAVSAHKRVGFEELLMTLQDGLATSFRGLDPGSFTADAVS